MINQRKSIKKIVKQHRAIKKYLLSPQRQNTKLCNCLKIYQSAQQKSIDDYDAEGDEVIKVWRPDRLVTNEQELQAIASEPIFITGNSNWQDQEIKANTREIGICKHLMKRITRPYLYQFFQTLIQAKKRFLEENHILYPVTLYAWFKYDYDVGGRPYLNFDFVSGDLTGKEFKLPFGSSRKKNSLNALIKKFIKYKKITKGHPEKHVFELCIEPNGAQPINSNIKLDRHYQEQYEKNRTNFKDIIMPRELRV